MFVIVDVSPQSVGIPTIAYCVENEIREDGTQKEQKTFAHMPSSIEAFEAGPVARQSPLVTVRCQCTCRISVDTFLA